MGLLGNLQRYALIAGLVISISSTAIALIQTFRVKTYQGEIKNLKIAVASLERAAVLVEDLRVKNTNLSLERDQLLKELRDAEGYDNPLPDGIDQLLERVR